MSKSVLRTVLTILMYSGVVLFFVPYLLGKVHGTALFQVGGVLLAVACGMLRCYWADEECWWHVH